MLHTGGEGSLFRHDANILKRILGFEILFE